MQIEAAARCRPLADDALLLQAEAWARANASAPRADDVAEPVAYVKELGWEAEYEARFVARIGDSLLSSATGQQDIPPPGELSTRLHV